MRDRKYRAWDKINKVFVYSGHCIEFDGSVHLYKQGCVIQTDHELTEWTSRVDKCGIDIFEGDIVKVKTVDGEGIFEIAFKNGVFIAEFPLCDYEGHEIEVVGNVFEDGQKEEKLICTQCGKAFTAWDRYEDWGFGEYGTYKEIEVCSQDCHDIKI